MTKDTTPAAVERLSWSPTDMVQMSGHGDYVYYADYAALSAQLEIANQRAYSLAYAIAGGEDAVGLLDSVNTDELCEMIRNERSLARDAEFSARAEGKAEAAKVTVQEAAKVLLGDDGMVEDLAIQTMRNNRPIDGKRVGYYPALLAALRAIAGGRDE